MRVQARQVKHLGKSPEMTTVEFAPGLRPWSPTDAVYFVEVSLEPGVEVFDLVDTLGEPTVTSDRADRRSV